MSSGSTQPLRRLSRALVRFESLHAFIIALVVIIAFVSFYGYVLLENRDSNFTGLEKVSSTLGNIVAVVIGYYFGQRPLQDIFKQAQEVAGQRDWYRNQFNDLYTQLGVREKEFKDLRSDIETIKKELGVE